MFHKENRYDSLINYYKFTQENMNNKRLYCFRYLLFYKIYRMFFDIDIVKFALDQVPYTGYIDFPLQLKDKIQVSLPQRAIR